MDSYKKVLEFKKKYKGTLAFRLKAHCKVLDKHLNPGEEIVYVFAGQKNSSSIAVPNTFVVALTPIAINNSIIPNNIFFIKPP